MLAYIERMNTEFDELNEKITKLNSFMLTHTFDELTVAEKYLLTAQRTHMLEYSDVLLARISLAKTKEGC